MNKLIINTANNKEVIVGLEIAGKRDMISQTADLWKSRAVLPLVMSLLKKHEITLEDLNAIEVNEGPGSFTGLRVGAAIANTLGIFLRIPINGKKIGEIVEPMYQ